MFPVALQVHKGISQCLLVVIGDLKNVCIPGGSVSALMKRGDLSIWVKSGDLSPLSDLSKENPGGPSLTTSPSLPFSLCSRVGYMGWRRAAALGRKSPEELQ